MNQTHNCYCCNGIRKHNGTSCEGCGTPIAACTVKKKKKPNSLVCPDCGHSGPHIHMESGRMRCKCGAVLESLEFSFLDTRPEVNAEKKERLELQRKRRN